MSVVAFQVMHKHGHIIAGPRLEIAAAVSCAAEFASDVAVVPHSVSRNRLAPFFSILIIRPKLVLSVSLYDSSRGGQRFEVRAGPSEQYAAKSSGRKLVDIGTQL